MAKKTTTEDIPSDLIGKKAPAFALPDQDGKIHKLADYKGQWVVLYAYPKDDTPGCTAESCGFRDLHADIKAAGAVVLGISILDSKSKKKFADKHGLTFPLLADEDSKVLEALGFWKEKSMYGKTYMGVSRETIIIDPKGVIVAHWPKAKGSADHAAEVLAKLRELQGQ
jgi:peroxiredoxin Q/BCP